MRNFRFSWTGLGMMGALAVAMAGCPSDDDAGGETENGTDSSSGTDSSTSSSTSSGTTTSTSSSTTSTNTTSGSTSDSTTTDDSTSGSDTDSGTDGDTDGTGSTGGDQQAACFEIMDETACDNDPDCQWFGAGQLGVCADPDGGGGGFDICPNLTTMQICNAVPGCTWNGSACEAE